MPNGSTGQSLKERLQAKLDADAQQIEALTSASLKQLESDLQQLSSAALSTTRDAIRKEIGGLKSELSSLAQGLHEQRQALQDEISANTTRLIWLMRWPLLLLAAICLLAVGGSWGWTSYQLKQASEAQAKLEGATEATNRVYGQWRQFCQSKAGRETKECEGWQ